MNASGLPLTHCGPEEYPVDVVDRLSPALRACVHDFGFSVVDAFVISGVRNANVIRHLINVVYRGAREAGNRRPVTAGARGLSAIDDVLRVHGVPSIGRALVATLRQHGNMILATEPSDHMIAASCDALSGAPVTYEQKHRLRLRAALKRGDQDRWGWLDQ